MIRHVRIRMIVFFVLLCSYPAFSAGITDSLRLKTVNGVLVKAQERFAPDKRLAVFIASIISEDPLVLNVETTEPQVPGYLKELFAEAKVSAVIKAHLLPDSSLTDRSYGIANLSVCNNRIRPEQSAELVTQILLGTPVRILKKERGYYLVRTPDQYLSWIEDNAVAAMDKIAFDSWKQQNKVVFTADYGHAFEKPFFDATRVSDLVAGNILVLKGKVKKFYQVIYPDGRTGYVPVKQCRP